MARGVAALNVKHAEVCLCPWGTANREARLALLSRTA